MASKLFSKFDLIKLAYSNFNILDNQSAIFEQIGSTVLAEYFFRTTQTEEKLKRDHVKGKDNAKKTHLEVRKKVRQTIKDLGGTMPEDLPTTESIKAVGGKKKKGIGK